MYQVRFSIIEDAHEIAKNLRMEDRRECLSVSGQPPEVILPQSVGPGCMTFTGLVDNRPVVMFGTARVTDEAASVWMVSTPELVKHQHHFLRECRGWVDVLNAPYKYLANVVDSRNKVHLKWLKWCGFTIQYDNVHVCQDGSVFYHFIRIKQ